MGTNFLADHPGGKKAIMLFAGKDATEEFDMLHGRKVIKKYGLDVGTVKSMGKLKKLAQHAWCQPFFIGGSACAYIAATTSSEHGRGPVIRGAAAATLRFSFSLVSDPR